MAERDTVQKKSARPSRDPVADNFGMPPDEELAPFTRKKTSKKTEEDLDDPFDNMPV